MAYFPFMIDITGKDCYVAGGGKIAYRKILDLKQFGAAVTVAAPEICKDIQKLPDLTILQKEYEDSDINNRFLVIAATDDEALNRRIARSCKERKILVNAVDIKDACSFIFPAMIRKNELVVSISTGGNSPAGAAYLKKKLMNYIPEHFDRNVELLGQMRDEITQMVPDAQKRKELYYDLLKLADEEPEGLLTPELITSRLHRC